MITHEWKNLLFFRKSAVFVLLVKQGLLYITYSHLCIFTDNCCLPLTKISFIKKRDFYQIYCSYIVNFKNMRNIYALSKLKYIYRSNANVSCYVLVKIHAKWRRKSGLQIHHRLIYFIMTDPPPMIHLHMDGPASGLFI